MCLELVLKSETKLSAPTLNKKEKMKETAFSDGMYAYAAEKMLAQQQPANGISNFFLCETTLALARGGILANSIITNVI